MKKVAIVQSNYIPWKGYFDMIAAVDEFILYDDAQFTKNDWRNRNQIKTQQGIKWLSIPVGKDISRRIRDVKLLDSRWQTKHWKSIQNSYRRAPYFLEIANILEPLFMQHQYGYLSILNRIFIEEICAYLGINTKISNSWEYLLAEGRSARIASLCEQARATSYISGPAAKDYMDEAEFSKRNISIEWFNYDGYPEYPQLWGEFVHGVSILDLLFNCGKDSTKYMKYAGKLRLLNN